VLALEGTAFFDVDVVQLPILYARRYAFSLWFISTFVLSNLRCPENNASQISTYHDNIDALRHRSVPTEGRS
jgi:hypothetical protein